MAYGIQNKVATAAGIQNSADYTHGEMCFYKDSSVINQAVQEQDKKKFLDLSLDLKKATTGEKRTDFSQSWLRLIHMAFIL